MSIWSLGQEDPLEEMATHSSILSWEILWTEEPSRLYSMGSQRAGHDEQLSTSTYLCVVFSCFSYVSFTELFGSAGAAFIKFRNFSSFISSNNFLNTSLSFPPGIPVKCIRLLEKCPHSSLIICSVFFSPPILLDVFYCCIFKFTNLFINNV